MLLCDFCLGGMIRYLGRAYTSNFLEFTSINACILALSNIPVNPGELPHDFPVMKQFFHQHIPYKYSLRSARKYMMSSNRYNNHCASNPYISSIHEKLAINIQNYYSITIPHWTLRFVAGLFLTYLGYATRKHKV